MTKAITRMDEIVSEISSKLDLIQKESICVGSLLIEAKEELQANGKKYADFIEWCGLNFNIGKAQASKLMKVATVFKEDDRFKGVAMRVLYALATNATPDQMDRAAEFAANGTLESSVVEQLLNPKPVNQKVEEQKELPSDEKEEELNKALASLPASDEVPFDTGTSEVVQEQDDSLLVEVKELKEALKAANELISSLKNEKIKHNNKPKPPFLPQFNSSFKHAVLGLAEEESKKVTKVKKAYRELIKCGYGDGHEAFELLSSAKDVLLADIEKAKADK